MIPGGRGRTSARPAWHERVEALEADVLSHGASVMTGSTLNVAEFERLGPVIVREGLVTQHDVDYVLDGIKNGFDLGVDETRLRGKRVHRNYKSAYEKKDLVSDALRKRVQKGKTLKLAGCRGQIPIATLPDSAKWGVWTDSALRSTPWPRQILAPTDSGARFCFEHPPHRFRTLMLPQIYLGRFTNLTDLDPAAHESKAVSDALAAVASVAMLHMVVNAPNDDTEELAAIGIEPLVQDDVLFNGDQVCSRHRQDRHPVL